MRRAARAALLLSGAAVGVAAAALVAFAQPSSDQGGNQSSGVASPSPPPTEATSPDQTVPETPSPPAKPPPAATNSAQTNSLSRLPPPRPPPPPPPPTPPPRPVRAASAVLQALDKVTAQTMRFEAPVGKPIRYKNLVFIVKVCETNGIGGPEPQSQAYVVIDFAPLPTPDVARPPAREVFKGWMYANSPSLNPFRHPIYDAWLIACTDQAPPG